MDSGNFSDNPTPQGEQKTKTLLQAMALLGYEIVNVGERDIRNGYDEFRRLTAGTPFHYISANIVKKETGEPVFDPYAIVELPSTDVKDVKIRVGVIGVSRYNPMFLKEGPKGSNIVIAHHVDSVRAQVDALQSKKVDIVVLLAALHVHDAKTITEQVPGIDYILGAYGGMFSQEEVGPTSVLYSGNRGQRLAEVRVFRREGQPVSAADIVRMHFLTHEYPDGAEMRRFLDEAGSATGVGAEEESPGGDGTAGGTESGP